VKRRHVLVIAWWFPPRVGGGVHRPLQFVRHLDRRGFRVSVLTGAPARGEPLDPGLLAQVPPSVRVVPAMRLDPFRAWDAWKRVRGGAGGGNGRGDSATNGPAPTQGGDPSWPSRVSEWLALPDRWLAWVPLAVAKAALSLRGDEPDLIFSTSPPHSAQLVARALRGLFGCPLVIDFRDPWVGNPFRRYASPRLARFDAVLERAVLRDAAEVILNTPALERDFRRRHPDLTRVRTIPNGFDPEAFEGLPPPSAGAPSGGVEIAHFGQLYGLRSGRFLLQGLARLKDAEPELFHRTRIALHGPIDGEAALRAQATALGVDGALLFGGALPHAESLARQRASDALLLLGPEHSDPEVQVPGKLYEYLAAQRPILALSRAGGAIAEMLELAGVRAERADPDSPEEIAFALARLLRLLRTHGDDRDDRGIAAAGASGDGVAAFRYDRLTDRLVACFEDAWSDRRGGASTSASAPARD